MSRGSSPYLKISPVFRTALQGRALWETAEQLGQIGAWEWNTRAERLVWSDNTFRLFGYEPGEVEPTPERAFERIHPADLERVRNDATEPTVHASVRVQDGGARLDCVVGLVLPADVPGGYGESLRLRCDLDPWGAVINGSEPVSEAAAT